jgi:hypothetical protein
MIYTHTRARSHTLTHTHTHTHTHARRHLCLHQTERNRERERTIKILIKLFVNVVMIHNHIKVLYRIVFIHKYTEHSFKTHSLCDLFYTSKKYSGNSKTVH